MVLAEAREYVRVRTSLSLLDCPLACFPFGCWFVCWLVGSSVVILPVMFTIRGRFLRLNTYSPPFRRVACAILTLFSHHVRDPRHHPLQHYDAPTRWR